MPTLPNTGVVTPTPGGDAGTWDDKNNAAWSNYDGHRHEPGSGLRIRTAGIDIDADLTFEGLYAPINLHRLTFASIVALTSNNKSLFVSDADNELYWRSNTGTNVKLTLGNALNVAAFAGGFGAGYSSAGAAADYDDSTEQYTFKQAAAGNWSRAGFGGIRLYEFGTSETVRVGLLANPAMAVSYDITLPEVPGIGFLQMDGTGNVMSDTLVQFNVSFDGTVAVDGLITASGGVTCAANQHLTISGTGELKHGDRVMSLSPLSGATNSWIPITGEGYMLANSAGFLSVPIDLIVGDRIKSVSFYVYGDSSADVTANVYSVSALQASASIGTVVSNNPPPSWNFVNIDVTDTTVVTGSSLFIHFSANANAIRVSGISVTYDHP